MGEEGGVLKINIYGTEYPIRSGAETNADYILKVAEYLDGKMREVDENIQSKSALKVAILAALNITDELFQERVKDKGEAPMDLGNRIRELTATLDEALNK